MHTGEGEGEKLSVLVPMERISTAKTEPPTSNTCTSVHVKFPSWEVKTAWSVHAGMGWGEGESVVSEVRVAPVCACSMDVWDGGRGMLSWKSSY